VYLRWGPTVPLDAGYFGKTLTTGWTVQVGGRSLFFNPEGTRAWTIDASISNVSSHGQRSNEVAVLHDLLVLGEVTDPITGTSTSQPVRVPAVGVTVSHLNRTFVNLGLGREWYIIGDGLHRIGCESDCNHGGWHGWLDGAMWRAGVDFGGRYGTAKLELHEINHRDDVIGGVWVSVHSDMEIPCGGCLFIVGGRFEWDYTWTDILQTTDTDLQNISFLMTLGIRF
jgi:hypothetical protein